MLTSSVSVASGSVRLAVLLGEDAMSQAAVAHGERLISEPAEHGTHDAGTGEDDVRALGLETDDLATLGGAAGVIELDLPVDLGSVEDGALNDVRVVLFQAMLHAREVRDRPAQADERVGWVSAVEPRQVGFDSGKGGAQHILFDDAVQAIPL